MTQRTIISLVFIIALLGFVLSLGNDRLSAPATSTEPPGTTTPSALVGTYRSDTLATADGGNMRYKLILNETGTATFISSTPEYEVATETGHWHTRASTLTFVPESAEPLRFSVKDLTLRQIDYNPQRWGVTGLTLTREQTADSDATPPLTNTRWQWQQLVTATTEEHPRDPDNFHLTFTRKGQLRSTTDCNTIQGSYTTIDDRTLILSELATTRMFCPDSQEDVYLSALRQVETYRFDGDTLILETADGSVLEFVAMSPSTSE